MRPFFTHFEDTTWITWARSIAACAMPCRVRARDRARSACAQPFRLVRRRRRRSLRRPSEAAEHTHTHSCYGGGWPIAAPHTGHASSMERTHSDMRLVLDSEVGRGAGDGRVPRLSGSEGLARCPHYTAPFSRVDNTADCTFFTKRFDDENTLHDMRTFLMFRPSYTVALDKKTPVCRARVQ